MATRRATTKQKAQPKEKHYCGECKHGVWITENWDLDLKGKPICLRCPYVKGRAVIRTDTACDQWIKDNAKDWKKE